MTTEKTHYCTGCGYETSECCIDCGEYRCRTHLSELHGWCEPGDKTCAKGAFCAVNRPRHGDHACEAQHDDHRGAVRRVQYKDFTSGEWGTHPCWICEGWLAQGNGVRWREEPEIDAKLPLTADNLVRVEKERQEALLCACRCNRGQHMDVRQISYPIPGGGWSTPSGACFEYRTDLMARGVTWREYVAGKSVTHGAPEETRALRHECESKECAGRHTGVVRRVSSRRSSASAWSLPSWLCDEAVSRLSASHPDWEWRADEPDAALAPFTAAQLEQMVAEASGAIASANPRATTEDSTYWERVLRSPITVDEFGGRYIDSRDPKYAWKRVSRKPGARIEDPSRPLGVPSPQPKCQQARTCQAESGGCKGKVVRGIWRDGYRGAADWTGPVHLCEGCIERNLGKDIGFEWKPAPEGGVALRKPSCFGNVKCEDCNKSDCLYHWGQDHAAPCVREMKSRWEGPCRGGSTNPTPGAKNGPPSPAECPPLEQTYCENAPHREIVEHVIVRCGTGLEGGKPVMAPMLWTWKMRREWERHEAWSKPICDAIEDAYQRGDGDAMLALETCRRDRESTRPQGRDVYGGRLAGIDGRRCKLCGGWIRVRREPTHG